MTSAAYGDTDGDTQTVAAFRAAEKKYQLHMQQTMRYRCVQAFTAVAVPSVGALQ